MNAGNVFHRSYTRTKLVRLFPYMVMAVAIYGQQWQDTVMADTMLRKWLSHWPINVPTANEFPGYTTKYPGFLLTLKDEFNIFLLFARSQWLIINRLTKPTAIKFPGYTTKYPGFLLTLKD